MSDSIDFLYYIPYTFAKKGRVLKIMENDEKMINVPYIVYEGSQARQERTTKRLMNIVILLISLLFISNALWLWAWNSYDYGDTMAQDVEIDSGEGIANFIGRDLIGGEILNGKNKGNDHTSQDADKS